MCAENLALLGGLTRGVGVCGVSVLSDDDEFISQLVLLEAVGAWGDGQVAGQHFVGDSVDEVGLCVEEVLEFVFCFH